MSQVPQFRIFIIGAGFSAHAGLPLGNKLFELVRDSVLERYGEGNRLEEDLRWYLQYRHHCNGLPQSAPVDYEEFMSYLDLEHYLRLSGSETFTEEGNKSQLMIRNAIQQVIYSRQPATPTRECIHFCSQLAPGDLVLTFNYDTLIENALDFLNKKYRLFPNRLKEFRPLMAVVDSDAQDEEIQIRKLHGSIDWYDKTPYLQDRAFAEQQESPWASLHPIFKDGSQILSTRLVEGLFLPDDPLQYIYRANDLSQLSNTYYWECSPLILSPSSSKILYANPLRSLWSGLNELGGVGFGLGLIGYSLPAYDEYARQALFHIMRNYTECAFDIEYMGNTKKPIRIIDSTLPGSSNWEIRKNYSFLNWDRTHINTNGLSLDSIDWLMS
jgi:hypothetical protein